MTPYQTGLSFFGVDGQHLYHLYTMSRACWSQWCQPPCAEYCSNWLRLLYIDAVYSERAAREIIMFVEIILPVEALHPTYYDDDDGERISNHASRIYIPFAAALLIPFYLLIRFARGLGHLH